MTNLVTGLKQQIPSVRASLAQTLGLERMTGIEPAFSAWEASVCARRRRCEQVKRGFRRVVAMAVQQTCNYRRSTVGVRDAEG